MPPDPQPTMTFEQWKASQGGGSSAAPSATGTPKVEARSARQDYLIGQTESVLAVLVKQGQTSLDELRTLIPESKMAKVQDQLQNSTSQSELAKTYNVPAAPTATATPPPSGLAGTGGGGALIGARIGAEAGSRPSISPPSFGQDSAAGSAGLANTTAGPAGRTVAQIKGTQYLSDAERAWYLQQTGGSSSSAVKGGGASGSTSGGGGGSLGSSAPAAGPDPLTYPGSAGDFLSRGAIGLPNNGGTAILNGAQYRRSPNAAVQNSADKLWYNTDDAGNPQGPGWKSETAANNAKSFESAGVAATSRFGNSPTAKAASVGGFQNQLDPAKSLFGAPISLDESIAAGATKGSQRGDILGTISNNGDNFYDITSGGISAGGGLTPVGNSMDPYNGFTGQMANGDSVGMSSILGNSGHDTAYWLSQMSGLPPSEIAKLNISTPGQALQFQQAIETARAQGMMPNLGSLYAMNEPATSAQPYGGAAGGSKLVWGSQNGGSSNTPYDQALAGFKDYALGSPDIGYLPGGSGSTQIGNVVYANSNLDPSMFASGGQFMTNGPLAMVDMSSGALKGIAGEVPGSPERVTIDPLGKGGKTTMQNGVGMFAGGGSVVGGLGKGGTTYAETPDLGYKPDNYLPGGGSTYNPTTQNTFQAPYASASGNPVNASFSGMSPEQKNLFTENTFSNVSAAPTGYNTASRLPIYTDQNPQFDYYKENGVNLVPVTKYVNMGGVPVQVTTYESAEHPLDGRVQKQNAINYLTTALTGGNAGLPANARSSFLNGIDPSNQQAMLARLYELDPQAAVLASAQMAQNAGNQDGQGNGGGRWGSPWEQDRNIENDAMRRRQYDIQGRNYARAGLPSPTILDIPRQSTSGSSGSGSGGGGTPDPAGPAYQRYNREVQNGYALPFDYEVGSPWYNRGNEGMGGFGGGWGGGNGGSGQGGGQWHGNQDGSGGHGGGQYGGGNQAHTMPMPGQPPIQNPQWGTPDTTGPWFNQLPWWARNARRYGPPVGTGMAGVA